MIALWREDGEKEGELLLQGMEKSLEPLLESFFGAPGIAHAAQEHPALYTLHKYWQGALLNK